MKNNLEKLGGLHRSQNMLLLLTQKGMSRQKAYDIIQKSATIAFDSNKKFEQILNKNNESTKYISSDELKKIFSNNNFKYIERIFRETFK